jgi:hypothetical protein
LKLVLNHMFTKNLRFFGQILHPQWPAQCPEMGQKRAFVLEGLVIKIPCNPNGSFTIWTASGKKSFCG